MITWLSMICVTIRRKDVLERRLFQVAAIKTEKKAREQKRRNKTLESRRALANVRVVQNNLVFVVGLPVRLADPEVIWRRWPLLKHWH